MERPIPSHRSSLRQGDYARRFRLEGPYTPQMVVDGDVQLVGSDEHEALRVIGNAAKVTEIPVTPSAPHLEGTNSLSCTCRCEAHFFRRKAHIRASADRFG